MEKIEIKGYEERYTINERCEVYSLPKSGSGGHNGRVLKQMISGRGYAYVILRKDNIAKHKFIHKEMAIAFIPNPENKPHVNHKDGNKLNNALGNLEWCTAKENTQHAIRTGLLKMNGEDNPQNKYSKRIIIKMRKLNELGITKKVISNIFNIHPNYVSDIILKKRWKHI